MIPLTLMILAILASAGVAYGTNPNWLCWWPAHGLDVILWTRRIEWPLMIVAILLCIGLAALGG